MKRYLFLLYMSVFISGFATDPQYVKADSKKTAEDFKAINEKFRSTGTLSEAIIYKMFDSYTAEKPSSVYPGFYIRKGNNIHTSLLSVESVQNNTLSIAVDTINKVIVITDPQKKNASEIQVVELEKVLGLCSGVFEKNEKQMHAYRLEFTQPQSQYKVIEIEVSKDNFIKKIVLYFNQPVKGKNGKKEKPKVEIAYENINEHPSVEEQEFSEHKFIDIKEGTYTPKHRYNSFRVINQKHN